MGIIAVKGKPRTGKGVLETRMGFENYRFKGHQVFGNYSTIYGKKVTIETMLTMPFEVIDRDLKTLLVQEADKIFDRMKMNSEVNRLLRSLVGQSGKRNLSMIYDTQYLNRVSPDLTDLTEMIITSSVYIDSQTKIPECFEYNFFEFNGREVTEDLGMKRYTKYDMAPYYLMYNTYEPTAPIWNYQEQKIALDDRIIEIETEKLNTKTQKENEEIERTKTAKIYDNIDTDIDSSKKEEYRQSLIAQLTSEKQEEINDSKEELEDNDNIINPETNLSLKQAVDKLQNPDYRKEVLRRITEK